MIKIEIDGDIYDFPDNWGEVNLEKLIELNKIQKMNLSSSIEMNSKIINILSGIPLDIILSIPLSDYTELVNLTTWIQNLPNKSVNSVMIDGVKYLPMDLNNISAGEFISIEVFTKDNSDDNLHLISSILIRPEVNGQIEKLKDLNDIQNRANLFKEKLMVDSLWPIVNNFFNGAALSSLKNTQDSSDHQKTLSKLRILNS